MTMFTRWKNRPIETILLFVTFSLVAISIIALKSLRYSTELTAFGIIAFLAICVAIGLFARKICDPLVRLARQADDWSAPDTPADQDDRTRKDEVGVLARSIARMRKIILSRDREQVQALARLDSALRRLSNGDLSTVLYVAFPEELENLRVRFNRLVSVLDVNLSAIDRSVVMIRTLAQVSHSESTELRNGLALAVPAAQQATSALAVLQRAARMRHQDANAAATHAYRTGRSIEEAIQSTEAANTILHGSRINPLATLARSAADTAIEAHGLAAEAKNGGVGSLESRLDDLATRWTQMARTLTVESHRMDVTLETMEKQIDKTRRSLTSANIEITRAQEPAQRLSKHVDIELQRISLTSTAVAQVQEYLHAASEKLETQQTTSTRIVDATGDIGCRISLFSPSAPATSRTRAAGFKPHLRCVK